MSAQPSTIDLARISGILRRYRGQPSMLLNALQEIQSVYTCVPPGALYVVARELELPLSRVFNVVTFYAALSLVSRGRHQVRICVGTACHLRGAEKVLAAVSKTLGIRQGDITPDGELGLETVNCLGACALAPVFMLDSKYIAKASPKDIPGLFPDRRAEAALDQKVSQAQVGSSHGEEGSDAPTR
ncbi:MAG: NAD(P)H-dependent oxidoreductase subunit E [Candidatus Wallbacteria bacterium]|nr:NAD(P)H-dependent oxidoreductase subunit E [Candidatus Wallbacteria bacterium]